MLNAVRSEYEDLVMEINSCQPHLGVLTWAHPGRLCYPRFKAVDVGINSTTKACATEDKHGIEFITESGVGDISLPRDRESLMELRRQLSMELLWLKQAIDSRQQVYNDNTF